MALPAMLDYEIRSLSAQAASILLQKAGFSAVETVDLPAGTVMVARR